MKILVIKPSSLGDVIHSMAFLKALKNLYPNSTVSWVISRNLSGLLDGHPLIDELIMFDKDKWQKLKNLPQSVQEILPFTRLIRKEFYDIVIDLQGLLRSGFITFCARGSVKAGFDTAREGSRYFYTHRVHTDGIGHAVDRYLEVVSYLARHIEGQGETAFKQPLLFPLPVDKEAAYAVIAFSARWLTKIWPPEHFAEVIARLPIEPVLIGGASDKPLAEIILNNSRRRGIDYTGKTSLKELVALIAGAQVVISNDTGPVHIAAALQVPLVAIYGPTSAEKTGPYGWNFPHSQCTVLRASLECSPCFKRKCSDILCLKSISPQSVLEAVKVYL